MAPTNSCDFCRKRKLKCSREEPRCGRCIQFDKECIYSPRPQRVPITKVHVQRLERKIKTLEELLLQFVKTRENLDTLLNCTDNGMIKNNEDEQLDDTDNSPNSIHSESNSTLKADDFLVFEDFSNFPLWEENDNDINDDDEINKMYDKSLSSFFESSVDVIDGMGALNIEKNNNVNKRNAFYGISSSNGLLRFLRSKLASRYQEKQKHHTAMKSLLNEANISLLKSKHSEVLLDDVNLRNELINSYFENYHKSYPFILKLDFMLQYETRRQNTKSYKSENIKEISFDILLNTILAIGSLCKLGESSIIDLLYYRRIRTSLQRINLMECRNYQILEAIIILGNYVQKRNKPNTCWNYHGLALRMAISFGLHKEVNALDLDIQDFKVSEILEKRRRLWWGLFFFDVGLSITFGRPIHSPTLESIDIRFPMNIEDDELRNLEKGKGIETLSKNYPTIYAGLIQEARLSKISYKIYNFITKVSESSENPISSMLWAINLNKLILNFIKSVPDYFQEDDNYVHQHLKEICPSEWFHIKLDGSLSIPKWFEISRRRMIWRYKNIQILMFRKFICESSSFFNKSSSYLSYYSIPISKKLLDMCISICHKAAGETITSISNFVNNCELDTFSSWYSTYFVFQAALIPILLLYMYPDISYEAMDIELCLHEIELSKSNLRVLKKYNNSAETLEETIQSLVSPILKQFRAEGSGAGDFSNLVMNNDFNNLPLAPNLFSGMYFDLPGINEMDPNTELYSNRVSDNNFQTNFPNQISDPLSTDYSLKVDPNSEILNSFLQNELLTDNIQDIDNFSEYS